MELAKNNASGKIFVVVDDAGGAELLVITPDGKVKSLERRLFTVLDAMDPKYPQPDCGISKKQMDVYEGYLKEESLCK
jgi:hypothetical protein